MGRTMHADAFELTGGRGKRMATKSEVVEALLTKVKEAIDENASVDALRWAEAFAWIVSPGSSHGSAATSSDMPTPIRVE